ncbi:tail fiber protein [Shewanella phage SppYZU05]|uniref:Uncharacterized protein n=1 Tax=Shewanella phage SppYZU05 TaxID=1970795 RepID=A0A1W6JTE7_9CAUD|nr:tail fiber protein [Shewanella phage SppYZU05]ARM70527.1 hypothetical protein SppYZU05_01 [Shewanella phage SppYZU05]
MATRPLYSSLWAQNAAPEDFGDADVYVPSNPVYPEQTENQYTVGWYVSPNNDLVKQPHQWVNSWAYTVDLAILELITNGSVYQPTISFRKSGIVHVEGQWWLSKADENTASPAPAAWDKAAFNDIVDLNNYAAVKDSEIEAHKGRQDNPHGVTPAQIQGYSKAQIDANVAVVQDDLTSYKQRRDNPHEVTAAQLNALSVAGGRFNGPVVMPAMRLPIGVEVSLSEGIFGGRSQGVSLGINPTIGIPTSNKVELVSDKTFHAIRQRYASQFNAPPPELQLPLLRDLTTYQSGYGGVELTGTIDFHQHGLLMNPDLILTATPAGVRTVVALGSDGVTYAVQTPTASTNLLQRLRDRDMRVSNLRAWSTPLTEDQCYGLGVSVWL